MVRVHKLVPKEVWEVRYELINNFEKNLVENGTHILKFYLHIGNSKWKQLTTEAKRDAGSKKDGKTAPKSKRAQKSDRATQHGSEAQLSEAPETKKPEEVDKSH